MALNLKMALNLNLSDAAPPVYVSSLHGTYYEVTELDLSVYGYSGLPVAQPIDSYGWFDLCKQLATRNTADEVRADLVDVCVFVYFQFNF